MKSFEGRESGTGQVALVSQNSTAFSSLAEVYTKLRIYKVTSLDVSR